MSDEAKKYPPAMKTYIQDDDGDLPYKLMVISNNDNNNEGANEGTPTAVGQPETNAAAANNSPISDTGTWEIVNPGDGN